MKAARIDANQTDVASTLRPWACATCGIEKRATVHQNRQTYCSRVCMASAYKNRMTGEGNSNYKMAGNRVCVQCSAGFKSYIKTRKYCSFPCYLKTKPQIPKPPKSDRPKKPLPENRPPRQLKSIEGSCQQCKKAFRYYPSTKRIFCSYKCHLDSGGAQRAGNAAVKATMKYGARKDSNHHEIVAVLVAQGATVIDTSGMGAGFPDLIFGISGVTYLMEIKNPKTAYGRRGLNKNQQDWHAKWNGGTLAVVDGPEAALRAIKVVSF